MNITEENKQNSGGLEMKVTGGGMKVGDKDVPVALLEILVQGVEDDRKKITKMTDKIQNQMDAHKRGKYARILWYVDKGEKSIEEKKQWLIDNSKCKYYIFAPDNYSVTPSFVKNLLTKIKRLEDSYISLKSSKIFIKNYTVKKIENNENNN